MESFSIYRQYKQPIQAMFESYVLFREDCLKIVVFHLWSVLHFFLWFFAVVTLAFVFSTSKRLVSFRDDNNTRGEGNVNDNKVKDKNAG